MSNNCRYCGKGTIGSDGCIRESCTVCRGRVMNIGVMAKKMGKIASHKLYSSREFGVKPEDLHEILRNMPQTGSRRGARDTDHRYFYKCSKIASATKQLQDAIRLDQPLTYNAAERIAIMANVEHVLAGYHERVYGIGNDDVVDTDAEVMRKIREKRDRDRKKELA